MTASKSRKAAPATTGAILRHWREAVPNDRFAHLIKDATRGLTRALQLRLTEHSVSFGHWTFLRILWEEDGLTQRELSERAGLMEPTTFSALKAASPAGFDALVQTTTLSRSTPRRAAPTTSSLWRPPGRAFM